MRVDQTGAVEVLRTFMETCYWENFHNPYEVKGNMLDFVCDILADDSNFDELFEGNGNTSAEGKILAAGDAPGAGNIPVEAFRRYMTGYWQTSTSSLVFTILRPKRLNAVKAYLEQSDFLPNAAMREHIGSEADAYSFCRHNAVTGKMGDQGASTGQLRGMFHGRRLQSHEMIEFIQIFHHVKGEKLTRVREFAFRFLDDFEDELVLEHHCQSQDYLEHQVRDGFVATDFQDGHIFLLNGDQSPDSGQSLCNYEMGSKGHRIHRYEMLRYGERTRMTLCQRPRDIERCMSLLNSL